MAKRTFCFPVEEIETLLFQIGKAGFSLQDLPDRIQNLPPRDQGVPFEIPEEGISLDDAINEFEKRLILQALNKTGWIKNKAAQLLNLNRTTLIEKIKRQNLQRPNS